MTGVSECTDTFYLAEMELKVTWVIAICLSSPRNLTSISSRALISLFAVSLLSEVSVAENPDDDATRNCWLRRFFIFVAGEGIFNQHRDMVTIENIHVKGPYGSDVKLPALRYNFK